MKTLPLALTVSLLVACGGQTFETAPSGTGGSAQAGSGQGGSTSGGSAGTAGAAGAKAGAAGTGGGAGGPSCACANDAACGAGKNCAGGVCKDKIAGRCWDDDECGAGATCQGASICPCNAACTVEDTSGTCKGTSTTDWSSCAKQGECLLAANTCCGACGPQKASDLDAVNYTKAQPHFEEVCPSPTACPDCATMENPALSAMCRQAKCAVIDVTTDPISACKVDADCALHAANECCNCTILPDESYVAIATTQMQAYELDVCGPGMGPCNLKCASQFPSSITAKCGADGHCKVAGVKPAAVCPVTPPQIGLCPTPGLECEYGASIAIACRARASCTSNGWELSASSCPPFTMPGQDGCPSTVAAGGGSCSSEGTICQLANGASCLCTGCAGGPCSANPKWACAKGGSGQCPLTAPNFGQACTTEGLSCTYGVNCTATGATRTCTAGVWKDVTSPCPL